MIILNESEYYGPLQFTNRFEVHNVLMDELVLSELCFTQKQAKEQTNKRTNKIHKQTNKQTTQIKRTNKQKDKGNFLSRKYR